MCVKIIYIIIIIIGYFGCKRERGKTNPVRLKKGTAFILPPKKI
jgi:hypothetical protein